MESLKEKLPMIIAVIIAIGILFFAYYFMFVRKDVYYTKIDNEKMVKAQIILESLIVGLESIIDSYPEYITLEYREV